MGLKNYILKKEEEEIFVCSLLITSLRLIHLKQSSRYLDSMYNNAK